MATITHSCDFGKQATLRAKENLFRTHPVEAGTKKPLLKGYKSLATRNARTLEKWAKKWPGANVGGIVPDRLAILDIDPRNGGDKTLAKFLCHHGSLERTVTVTTPSGGSHYYFFLPIGVQLKPYTKLGPGLELLSSSWNILLPGSIGDNGRSYQYEISPSECQVAPLPAWLLKLALEAQIKKRSVEYYLGPGGGRSDSFSLPSSIPDGTRTRALVSCAASLRSRGHSERQILALLFKVNEERCIPSVEQKKVESIAEWAGSLPLGQATALPEALAAFDNLEAAIRANDWSGRFAFNCRRVAEALLALMREKGKTSVDAGVRFVSLHVGLSRATTARCLRALRGREKKTRHSVPRLFDCRCTRLRADFVQFNAKTARHEQQTHCYSISRNIIKLRQDSLPREGGAELLCLKMMISHDAFRSKKGMSGTRAVALEAIERSEIHSAAELSEKTSLTLITAQRCLTEMRKEGLIQKEKKVWRRTELDLDTVAKKRGSAGATAAQRAQYERDRENYAERLAGFVGEESSDVRKGERELTMVPAPERHRDVSPPNMVWFEDEGMASVDIDGEKTPVLPDQGWFDDEEKRTNADYEEVKMAASFKSRRRRGKMAA